MASSSSQEQLAVRLALAIKRIRARLQETRPARVKSLPISQLAILKRLRDDGPTTAARLATAEHVSQQAIAQHVAVLRDAGLVKTTPDRHDKRKILVTVTANGMRLFDAAAESRNEWLMRAIAEQIPAKEQRTFTKAVELLERLASADAVDT